MLLRFVSATVGLVILKIASETLVGAEHLESVYKLRYLCFSLASPSALFFWPSAKEDSVSLDKCFLS